MTENELFVTQNADLIESSSDLIANYSFAPFMAVHCKIPEEEHAALLTLQGKERVIATLKASRCAWTRMKFEEFIKGGILLRNAGLPAPTLAEVTRPPCCCPK